MADPVPPWTPYINDGVSYYQPVVNRIMIMTPGGALFEHTVITTAVAHNYLLGDIVTFKIPVEFGMQQMNGLQGTVVALNPALPTFLSVNIDSRGFDTFNFAAVSAQVPQIIPIGSTNDNLNLATKNILRTGVR